MPDAAVAPAAVGLLIKGGAPAPVPLSGVVVEASLKDFASRVVVSQRYRNDEARPIEAVYVFPLEEAAAVCGFEAIIDGVHVVGEVEEREKAFARYDDALAAGHGAYLLDQEKPDVFTASIGNVPAGKEVLVRITYVAELDLEGDEVRFALPTTVSPRYAPAEDHHGVGRPPSDVLNPPTAWSVPYGLSLTVELDMHAGIRALASPTHPVSVEFDGGRGRVTLGAREVALDRDFVLNVRLAEDAHPWVRVERDEAGREVAALSFQPTFDTDEAATELIFLVDQSGSMEGTSMDEARNALQLCLRSLTSRTHFNIVGFGSTVGALFPESRPYDDDSLGAASRHVANMRADRGGTEILAPLVTILGKQPSPERPRQLFVLTDGQVTNTEAVIAEVRRHSSSTRVFTFGIGAGASRHLVRGMARAGGGAAEFIAPGERLERKVLRQLTKALAPAVSEVAVDWGGLRVRQAPHHLPPCFAGGRLLVYGMLEGQLEAAEVTLRARGPRGPLSFALRVDAAAAETGCVIGTLAARTLIRDLEEGASPLHDRRGSLQDRGAGKDRVKDEIVRLGVAYRLCSKHTSFVAVEHRESPTTEGAELRRVPVALTSGWGGDLVLGSSSMTGAFSLGLTSGPTASAVRFGSGGDAAPSLELGSAIRSASPRSSLRARLSGLWTKAPGQQELAVSPSTRPLDRLVALQRADGSWDMTKELAAILGRSLSDLKRRLVGASGDKALAPRALATALALRWLEDNAGDSRDEWSLLERKARRFLEECPARPASGREWSEELR